MIDKFESNQVVLYFPGGYRMHLKPLVMCHMSNVLCLLSHATFQPFPNCKSYGPAVFAWYSTYPMCPVSHVMCQVWHVTCDMSHVTCDMSHVMWHNFHFHFLLQIVGVSWWRVCYQWGLTLLVFGSLKKENLWLIHFKDLVIG